MICCTAYRHAATPERAIGAERQRGRLVRSGGWQDPQDTEYVLADDYEALRLRFERACAEVTRLSAQSETASSRWAVFCALCKKEWHVAHQHPGKSICEDCERRFAPSAGTTIIPDAELLLDNAATASQVRELLRDDDGEETVLREAVRRGVYEPMAKLLRVPSAMEPISAFIAAAKRFAEAHVNSDALDAQDDVGVEVGAWRYEAADREYNSSKAALVKAFIALPKDASVGPGGDHG